MAARTPTPLGYDFPLLGVPLSLRTNDERVESLARRTFGLWEDLPADRVRPDPALPLRVVVGPRGGDPAARAVPFAYRHHEGTLLGSDADIAFVAERGRGALCCLAADALGRGGAPGDGPALRAFRRSVLECMALFLATSRDRAPLHAAAVVRGARALLIAGPSGAGKSTLAYGLFRHGFRLLAEDAVYVEAGASRLWGHPAGFHLSPDNRRHFPELEGLAPSRLPSGKVKLDLQLTSPLDRPKVLGLFEGEGILCALSGRTGGRTTLERVFAEEVIAPLTRGAEPGFDLEDDLAPVRRLLAGWPAYRLEAGEVEAAVDLLEGLFEAEQPSLAPARAAGDR